MVSFSTVCRTSMEYYLSLNSSGIWIPKAKTKKKQIFIWILIQEKLEIILSIYLLIIINYKYQVLRDSIKRLLCLTCSKSHNAFKDSEWNSHIVLKIILIISVILAPWAYQYFNVLMCYLPNTLPENIFLEKPHQLSDFHSWYNLIFFLIHCKKYKFSWDKLLQKQRKALKMLKSTDSGIP